METNTENIKETLKEYIVKRFLKSSDSTNLSYDTPLISGGLIDSILTMQLVVFIEETYKFEFSAHEVDRDNLDSINIITNYIQKKINE